MTQINYDEIGRQELLADPNHGEVTYDYNAFGELILQSDNSGTFSMTYDDLGRPESKHNTANPLESYSWKYSNEGAAKGNVTETTGPEGYLEQIEYNSEGNPDKITLNENYIWNSKFDGRDRPTKKSFPSGIELEYVYNQAKGYLQQVKFKDVVLWEKGEVDVFGQPISNKRFNGLIVDEYAYDNTGSPRFYKTRANGELMFHWEFEFENESGNLLAREDKLAVGPYSKEYFKYDQYDRLEKVAFNDESNVVLQMEYDDNGNILSKSDISGGVYEYDSEGRPHAVLGINKLAENHGISNNVINYTSFHQPQTISNSDKSFNLSYGADQQRFTMTAPVGWQESGHQVTEKVYLGSEEWLKVDDEWYYNHHVFVGDKLIALIQGKIDSQEQPEVFFPVCDYLGSIYGFIKKDGNGNLELVDKRSYDAWGKLRNPLDWTDKDVNSLTVTNRGYTFHEHLLDAGLINMNGRLYDPVIARMLSPDNYVQNDGNPQNYNRYSYVLNNPLKYTDPNGEFIVWSIHKGGFSIGVNFTPIGIGGGGGLNFGWGDGVSVGVYGEVGYRVGGDGFGAGAAVTQSVDYNFKHHTTTTTTSAGVYASLGPLNAGANAASTYDISNKQFLGYSWGVSAGVGVGNEKGGIGLFVGYGSGGWSYGLGGYYDPNIQFNPYEVAVRLDENGTYDDKSHSTSVDKTTNFENNPFITETYDPINDMYTYEVDVPNRNKIVDVKSDNMALVGTPSQKRRVYTFTTLFKVDRATFYSHKPYPDNYFNFKNFNTYQRRSGGQSRPKYPNLFGFNCFR